jgi:hypothetical protein
MGLQGTSLEDFNAAKLTADCDTKGGQDFLSPVQFLTIVYQNFAKQL